ncbi:MAG: thiamine diphosphokinase [Candidatus Bipolaricaulota bacterium]|nr:thiamine diphosphokinase [Candidatus Bipolaricaulota bacterium]
MEETRKAARGRKVLVVASGEPPGEALLRKLASQADLVVAADGGARHLARAGLAPDVVVGDLDSLDGPPPPGAEVHKSPREKDATDLELALDHVARLAPGEVHLCGALGGRLDHALATVQLLTRYAFPIVLHHPPETLYLVSRTLDLPAQIGDRVSLLPLTDEARGVTTRGLRYALSGATLLRASTRGVSNEVVALPCGVEVAEGKLLLVHGPMT